MEGRRTSSCPKWTGSFAGAADGAPASAACEVGEGEASGAEGVGCGMVRQLLIGILLEPLCLHALARVSVGWPRAVGVRSLLHKGFS